MTRQLSFDLPVYLSLGLDDFFVSDANAEAFAMIRASDGWPDGKLALIGPAGSGKSHLARLWEPGGPVSILNASAIGPDPGVSGLAPHVVVEDMDRLPEAGEIPLFHLHNRLAATGGRLLMTSVVPPARWTISLPDLKSRMLATAIIRLGDPDDRLLAAVLTKLFADRQLSPSPEVISALVKRMERSFSAAARTVEALDKASMAEGREINLPLLRDVLDKLANETQ